MISPAISHPLRFPLRLFCVCVCVFGYMNALTCMMYTHTQQGFIYKRKSIWIPVNSQHCRGSCSKQHKHTKTCYVALLPNHTAVTGSNQLCYKRMRLMCTSWVNTGAREYSLTNHTGPPVLWSQIRLARRPNYSQSKPIKYNYEQLWIIRMPRRLIAQRDGAAGCHFQETVTLIASSFLLRSLHLCPRQSAGSFQRMATDFKKTSR